MSQETKKRVRSSAKTDEILKVCPSCYGVWSDVSIHGEKFYQFYRKGTLPTIGKKREYCKDCGSRNGSKPYNGEQG